MQDDCHVDTSGDLACKTRHSFEEIEQMGHGCCIKLRGHTLVTFYADEEGNGGFTIYDEKPVSYSIYYDGMNDMYVYGIMCKDEAERGKCVNELTRLADRVIEYLIDFLKRSADTVASLLGAIDEIMADAVVKTLDVNLGDYTVSYLFDGEPSFMIRRGAASVQMIPHLHAAEVKLTLEISEDDVKRPDMLIDRYKPLVEKMSDVLREFEKVAKMAQLLMAAFSAAGSSDDEEYIYENERCKVKIKPNTLLLPQIHKVFNIEVDVDCAATSMDELPHRLIEAKDCISGIASMLMVDRLGDIASAIL